MNHTCLYSPAAEHHRTLAGTHFSSRWGSEAELAWWLGKIRSTSRGGLKSNSRPLSLKLLAVSRETKLTLSIALNPKSKLTLERGTNLINRNTTACLSVHYRHPQQDKLPVIS